MKTPQTPGNLAILALVRSINSDMQGAAQLTTEAEDAATVGDLNMAAGALMPVRDRLALVLAQLDAVTALHQAARK